MYSAKEGFSLNKCHKKIEGQERRRKKKRGMTYITRSSKVVQRDVQMRPAVLRGHFSSPALIPAVDYKLYPILCQLTFVPYTLHL